ncbi:hypothetical protein V6N11_046490 [Hibiscus sabdariffa]|uniref:Uncharacterized protein n=1 Tax=Hibiscus sabdariffa TaxID=183260 RepID=A0ABR2P286_9ROSI
MLEALPLCTCIYRSDWLGKRGFGFRQNPTDGKPLFRVEWCTLNLKRGEFSETLSTMPPEARRYGTSVSCGNRIYVLGGDCTGDLFCPDGKFNSTHLHNCVFYFDSARRNCGWKRGPSMLVSRWFPSAVAAGGKIYVFGSTRRSEGYFAEVFSVELDRWDLLPEPPVASGLVPESVSDHVLLDASRSRILVHFKSNNSLQAFHFHADGGSWECVDPEFGLWSEASGRVVHSESEMGRSLTTLNLKWGEVSETLSTMPPETRMYGTVVACGNCIYVLGGDCSGDLFCPNEKFGDTHFHNCVFYFDSGHLNCGWKKGPSMLVSRWLPSAVAAGGKIYVFGSSRAMKGHFAEVFSVELNRWDKLSATPPPRCFWFGS